MQAVLLGALEQHSEDIKCQYFSVYNILKMPYRAQKGESSVSSGL